MHFIESQPITVADDLTEQLNQVYRMDETACVDELLAAATLSPEVVQRIQQQARAFINVVREQQLGKGGVDGFMAQYGLSSDEGIALMCLAESLLRIPDEDTIDKLIADKVTQANWQAHVGKSESLFVNAATWGLMLTGKVLQPADNNASKWQQVMKQVITRSGEPVIRQAIKQAIRLMGRQFVMGQTIAEALSRAKSDEQKGYRYSYDMLGEAARTRDDAVRYFKAYEQAIVEIGAASGNKGVIAGPGISVKLSALHPRYEFAKAEQVKKELTPLLLQLALQAKVANIGLTVDAEEADRLQLSLDIIAAVFSAPELDGWEGFGLAVQAYQKRAYWLIDWLAALAKCVKRRLMVRLVKGAYWDSEIKRSQEMGVAGYPVFTRKQSTDVSYLACAKKLLAAPELFYPQFATHNAFTLATIIDIAEKNRDFEFQRLHGMGEALHAQVVERETDKIATRIYAPVGSHKHLLAYLVRRLLENGANTSFVNRIADASAPVDELVVDPCERLARKTQKAHPGIVLPPELYGATRLNSMGYDLSNSSVRAKLQQQIDAAMAKPFTATPLMPTLRDLLRESVTIGAPANRKETVGQVQLAHEQDAKEAMDFAIAAQKAWNDTPVEQRANYLLRAADLLEQQTPLLMGLLIKEAGKTLPNAINEIREAVDFCRYYAVQAIEHLANPVILPGPTGEQNQLQLVGRGVIVCISPWNFPLAIFLGQVVAALVTGNVVIAKPAEQTPLIAYFAVKILHQAGIPLPVIQLLPGDGETIGAKLVQDERLAGVIFTGSTITARLINQTLAARKGPIVPLIAETGGQNALIIDSSALLEQVVADTLSSAFDSAGQRCSALRVVFVQQDIADDYIVMLKGAMMELTVGDPTLLANDIGPVIDEPAKAMLLKHIVRMKAEATLLYEVPVADDLSAGTFVAPVAFELKSLAQLPEEVFGPVLHVIRYASSELDTIIAEINATGYGLTFGVHSRIESTIRHLYQNTQAGNTYVNRNIVGAVVGVQPFGGQGLSGTGPKAGGPHYLLRLVTERVLTINTTAMGGNASLLSLDDDA